MSVLSAIGRTPLVPLERLAAGCRVPVLAKCEHLNPGGSVKDRIALAIVDDAEARGALAAGGTLVEATAGNTGIGLALVAAVRGYRLVCVMPEKMCADKVRALEAVGAEVVITPNRPPTDPDNFQRVAERLAAENGWFLTDQFRSPANVRAHQSTTGPEILEQTGGRIGAFVAAADRRHRPRSSRVLSPSSRSVTDEESFALCRRLIRRRLPGPSARKWGPRAQRAWGYHPRPSREEGRGKNVGLLVGGSAGTAVAAALRVAADPSVDGPVVVLLPDSWDRYLSRDWLAGSLQ